MTSNNPPTNAAQLDKPATIPRIKNASKDEFASTPAYLPMLELFINITRTKTKTSIPNIFKYS